MVKSYEKNRPNLQKPLKVKPNMNQTNPIEALEQADLDYRSIRVKANFQFDFILDAIKNKTIRDYFKDFKTYNRIYRLLGTSALHQFIILMAHRLGDLDLGQKMIELPALSDYDDRLWWYYPDKHTLIVSFCKQEKTELYYDKLLVIKWDQRHIVTSITIETPYE